MKKKLKNRFDIIIIGAGLSGLCLAVELINRTNKKILILEKEKYKKKDKNWCFWNTPKNYFSERYDYSWEKIKIQRFDEMILKSFKDIKYLNISSNKFYDDMIKKISLSENSKILFNQKISLVKEELKYVNVTSNKIGYEAMLLFDSRIKKYPDNELTQNFFGMEVTASKAVFNEKIVTLMDFQRNKRSTHFFYLLPFSKKKALIETTYFSIKKKSETGYTLDIKNYLLKNFPNVKFKFGFKESGIIPMFRIENNCVSKKILKIGLSNNWSRLSTGYAFQNSFLISKKIVDLIIIQKPIVFNEKKITIFLDKIFCKFLITFPKESPNLFFTFFTRLDLKTIVNFLTNNYSILELIKILIALPKLKLIYSMFLVMKNDK